MNRCIVDNKSEVALLAVSWGGGTGQGFKKCAFNLLLFSVRQSHIRGALLRRSSLELSLLPEQRH